MSSPTVSSRRRRRWLLQVQRLLVALADVATWTLRRPAAATAVAGWLGLAGRPRPFFAPGRA